MKNNYFYLFFVLLLASCLYNRVLKITPITNSKNNYLIFETKTLVNEPGYKQLRQVWLSQYRDIVWKETYSVEIKILTNDFPRIKYINPTWTWRMEHYPPSFQAYTRWPEFRTLLFRFNCVFKLPMPAGENVFFITLGSFYHGNVRVDGFPTNVVRFRKTFNLKPNQSIYLDLNPKDLSKSTFKVIPTPKEEGPCEFRDKYLREQAQKRKQEETNNGKNTGH